MRSSTKLAAVGLIAATIFGAPAAAMAAPTSDVAQQSSVGAVSIRPDSTLHLDEVSGTILVSKSGYDLHATSTGFEPGTYVHVMVRPAGAKDWKFLSDVPVANPEDFTVNMPTTGLWNGREYEVQLCIGDGRIADEQYSEIYTFTASSGY